MTDPIVVMGVSGSGKSTVGAALAAALGVAFVDGDALHPPANIAKMAAGIPLDDADRAPWLDAVGATLAHGAVPDGIVVACSALRRVYRDRLRQLAPSTLFLSLQGTRDLLAQRIGGRQGHFMPAALLDSQLAAFEPPQPDERAIVIDVSVPVEEIVREALLRLR